MNFFIIGPFVSLIISICLIIVVIYNRKKIGPISYSIFYITVILFLGVIYPFSLTFSTISFFSKVLTFTLWKFAVLIATISLGLLGMLYGFFLEGRKLNIVSSLIFCFLGALILYDLFNTDSIEISQIKSSYYYHYSNRAIIISLIFLYFLISFMWYIHIRIRNNLKKIDIEKLYFLISIQLTLLMVNYSWFIISQNLLFIDIHLILFWIVEISILYLLIKVPNFLVLLTNEIDTLVVFHKSGILLYVFNFTTENEENENLLKGSILIGISHILNNFLNREEQLNVIKMREKVVQLKYDNTHGYALLIISTPMTKILKKAINEFMNEFTTMHKENFEKINNSHSLIDISVFQTTKQIIIKDFSLFLKNS